MQIHESFMKPEELAAYLAVTKRTIYRWVAKRIIPFSKIEGRIRFKGEEIQNYLDEKKVDVIK
jgi:excisionase family DNA binding protein